MNIGEKIPEILGSDEKGHVWTRAELSGKKVILYFYPKDNTSGCTAEACSLRDGMSAIAAAGYMILGVSRDSASSHQRFIDKYSIPYPLISDVSKELHQAMHILYPKKMYGKDVIGAMRTTFLIDETGTIVHKWEGKAIDTHAHAEQILKEITKEKE